MSAGGMRELGDLVKILAVPPRRGSGRTILQHTDGPIPQAIIEVADKDVVGQAHNKPASSEFRGTFHLSHERFPDTAAPPCLINPDDMNLTAPAPRRARCTSDHSSTLAYEDCKLPFVTDPGSRHGYTRHVILQKRKILSVRIVLEFEGVLLAHDLSAATAYAASICSRRLESSK